MTLHRPPPPPESCTLPDVPPPVEVDGRLCWPTLLHYEIAGDPDLGDVRRCPYPPAEREDVATTRRRQPGERYEPRTAPYRLVVAPGALAAVDLLRREGWLSDPRHTGVAREPVIDARKVS